MLMTHQQVEADRYAWSFTFQAEDGSAPRHVCDQEFGRISSENLELRTLVWALESLDEASQVTILCRHASLIRGIRQGLPEWREKDWRWESFGEMVPISHQQLWRRLDRALSIHQVKCRLWRIDAPQTTPPKPKPRLHQQKTGFLNRLISPYRLASA
ncbi:Hypothetical protein PBC10988_35580 [Planctomycetales bacterium 10988]|nr:Hypothetical protein PBC10988_35580 [Planctomycetales bacterium 10988]